MVRWLKKNVPEFTKVSETLSRRAGEGPQPAQLPIPVKEAESEE